MSNSGHKDIFKRAKERNDAYVDGITGVPRSDIYRPDLHRAHKQGQKDSIYNRSKKEVPAMPVWVALPLVGVSGIGALLFGISIVSDTVTIRPSSGLPNATNFANEDYSMFETVCATAGYVRLAASTDASSRFIAHIQGNTTVGILPDYDTETQSRVVISVDVTDLQRFLGIYPKYMHGYVPSDRLVNCQENTNFSPEDAYQINPNNDRGSRNRRDEAAVTNTTLTTLVQFIVAEETPEITPEVVYTPTPVTSCVTAESGVNVRQGPMINSPVMATLPFNTAVEHAGPLMNVDWQRVEIDSGAQGYIHAYYLRRSPNELCPS